MYSNYFLTTPRDVILSNFSQEQYKFQYFDVPISWKSYADSLALVIFNVV